VTGWYWRRGSQPPAAEKLTWLLQFKKSLFYIADIPFNQLVLGREFTVADADLLEIFNAP
jgi:hypothetical protein